MAVTLRSHPLRRATTKPVALETLSFLAMKDAHKLLYPDVDENSSGISFQYASKSTKSSSKSMLLRDIVKCVTGASRRVIRDAKKNCARVLARELSIRDPKRALKALSALSFDDSWKNPDEESEGDEDAFNGDEDEDEENEEGEMDEEEIDESDIDEIDANNHRISQHIYSFATFENPFPDSRK